MFNSIVPRNLIKFLPKYYSDILKIKSNRILSKIELIIVLNKFYDIPLIVLNEMNNKSLNNLHRQKILDYATQKWQLQNFNNGQIIKNNKDTKKNYYPIIKYQESNFDIIKEFKNFSELKKKQKNEYYNKPGMKEKLKKYQKEYYQRPEVKERIKKNRKRPEVKERIKKNRKRPEVKERIKEYYQKPEVKERIKKYQKKYRKKYLEKPEIKERIKKHQKKYRERPEVKERIKKYKKEYYQRLKVKERINKNIKIKNMKELKKK